MKASSCRQASQQGRGLRLAQVDAAAKQILDLMEPGDDAIREERKRAQLRELALLNGTVRVRCPHPEPDPCRPDLIPAETSRGAFKTAFAIQWHPTLLLPSPASVPHVQSLEVGLSC